jgi:hypothetical protein
MGCFPAGAAVTMADGSLRAIERVRAGDWVQSYDSESRTLVPTVVLETRRHDAVASHAGFIRVNGRLSATPNHPIWTPQGSKPAGRLVVGDSIVSTDEHGAAASDVVRSIEVLAGDEDVFDIRVAEPGNYFVGGILVVIKPADD